MAGSLSCLIPPLKGEGGSRSEPGGVVATLIDPHPPRFARHPPPLRGGGMRTSCTAERGFVSCYCRCHYLCRLHGGRGLVRLFVALVAVFAAIFATPAAPQVTEPRLRLVFPLAPGGSGDALARLIAEHLRAGLKRPVIVENRTGAAGRLGVQAVRSATPDGATLLIAPIAPMSVY